MMRSAAAGTLMLMLLMAPLSPARGRDLDALQRRFAILHGIDYVGQGHLHTEPRGAAQGNVTATMQGSLRLSWSTAVHRRHGFVVQTFTGACTNLGSTEATEVRIELVRTPLAGARAGRSETIRSQILGTLVPGATRQVFLEHRAPSTETADYAIRVR